MKAKEGERLLCTLASATEKGVFNYMATSIKEGDLVTFADREATAEDAKSQLFYDFYRGLTGKVSKVYPTDEVAVEVDQDSLPAEVSLRHREMQDAEMKKWLDSLYSSMAGFIPCNCTAINCTLFEFGLRGAIDCACRVWLE